VSGDERRAVVRTRIRGGSFPARAGIAVAVQRSGRHGFRTVARGRTVAGGGYSLAVPGAGRYRVRIGAILGPTVVIR
jgi:hypothetical protein